WWLGATQGSWHEARHVRRARAAGARTPVAVSADGVRGDPAVLRAPLSGVAARAGWHAQRIGGGRRQLPAGGLGNGVPEAGAACAPARVRWSVAAFQRAPFWTTAIVILSPIPDSAVRVLAPLARYPLPKFLGAVALGRFPRLLLIAGVGGLVPVPTWGLLGGGVALVGLAAGRHHVGSAFRWLRARYRDLYA